MALNFVGRNNEIASIQELIKKAAAGKGQTIFIAGEPGIGKTTLIKSVVDKLQENEDINDVIMGSCNELIGDREPYAPFFQILDQLLGREKHLRSTEITNYIKNTASSWIFTLPNARTILKTNHDRNDTHYLASSSELTSTENLYQNPVIQEYTSIIANITGEKLLVIILEDLHWIDKSSVNLLFYLSKRISEYPILILGSYRSTDISDLKGMNPFLDMKLELIRMGKCTEISLDFLSFNDFKRFSEMIYPGKTFENDSLIALYHKTSGNPLFMVEMFKLVQERKLLVETNGVLTIGLEFELAQIPGTLDGILKKRIGLLSKILRKTLLCASVEGEQFSSIPLSKVFDRSKELDILERLNQLDRGYRLIKSIGEQLATQREGSYYQFVHSLIQKFCYSQLSNPEKYHLHKRFAEILEKIYGEEVNLIYSRLAVHFENGAATDKAIYYYTKAADRAFQVFAFLEALENTQRSLYLLDQYSNQEEFRLTRAELLARKAKAYALMGLYKEAISTCNACDILCENITLKPLAPSEDIEVRELFNKQKALEKYLLLIDERMADYPLSVDIPLSLHKERTSTIEKIKGVSKLLDKKEKNLDRKKQGHLYCKCESYRWRAFCHAHKNDVDYDASTEYYRRALDIFYTLDDRTDLGIISMELGDAYRRQGKTQEAILALENSLKIQQDFGQFNFRALTMLYLGWIYLRNLKDFPNALEYFGKGLELCESYPDQRTKQQLLRASGTANRQLGNYQLAEDFYKQALNLSIRIGDSVQEAISINSLGVFYTDKGEWNNALECYLHSLKKREEIGAVVGVEYHNVGCTYQRMGEWASAQEFFKKSLSIYQRGNGYYGIYFNMRELASLHFLFGDMDKASYFCNEALNIAEKENYPAKGVLIIKANILLFQNKLNEAKELFMQEILLKGGVESQINSLVHGSLCLCLNGLVQEGLETAQKASRLARESDHRFGKALASLYLGKALHYSHEYNQALDATKVAYYELSKLHSYHASDAALAIGGIELSRKKTKEAMDFITIAVEESQKLGYYHKQLEANLLEAEFFFRSGLVDNAKNLIHDVKHKAKKSGFILLSSISEQKLHTYKFPTTDSSILLL